MVYTQDNCKDLREKFVSLVFQVFGSDRAFIEFIEETKYGIRFNVFWDSYQECYIIDRHTGRYINWYKFYHLGRDIHTNIEFYDLKNFLILFKNSGDC